MSIETVKCPKCGKPCGFDPSDGDCWCPECGFESHPTEQFDCNLGTECPNVETLSNAITLIKEAMVNLAKEPRTANIRSTQAMLRAALVQITGDA